MTTPLEVFLQLWTAKVPSVPYVETVNSQVDVSQLADVWGGVVYQPTTRTDETMGSRPWVLESGTFLIGLFARAGTGPAALDAAVAEVRAGLHGAALNGLHIVNVDGPHDLDPEGDGEWWRLALVANFEFHERRDATQPPYSDWAGFPA